MYLILHQLRCDDPIFVRSIFAAREIIILNWLFGNLSGRGFRRSNKVHHAG